MKFFYFFTFLILLGCTSQQDEKQIHFKSNKHNDFNKYINDLEAYDKIKSFPDINEIPK